MMSKVSDSFKNSKIVQLLKCMSPDPDFKNRIQIQKVDTISNGIPLLVFLWDSLSKNFLGVVQSYLFLLHEGLNKIVFFFSYSF